MQQCLLYNNDYEYYDTVPNRFAYKVRTCLLLYHRIIRQMIVPGSYDSGQQPANTSTAHTVNDTAGSPS
jgi:hypothetical protein